MLKPLLAIIAGVLAAMATFLIVEQIGHSIYPAPAGLDFQNKAVVATFMENRPIAAYLLVWVGWLVGSFEAGFLAQIIAKLRTSLVPAIIGGLLTASAVLNFVLLPHPVWFVALGVVTFVPVVFAGWKLAQRFTGGHE